MNARGVRSLLSLLLLPLGLRAAETVFYPPLPDAPRLQFLKGYSSEKDFGGSDNWFKRLVFGAVREGDALGKPYGLAVRGTTVYLCDTGAGDVRVIDVERRKFRWLSASGGAKLKRPINITIDGAGNKYVADAGLDRVVVFDAADKYTRSYRDETGWKPVDVAVDGIFLYVLDIDNHQVKVLERESGKILRAIGSAGSGEGQLYKPTNLALNGTGDLYVSDTVNFRVVLFAKDGRFLRTVGALGQVPGTFSRPRGIAVDPEGRLFVADAAFDNVQIFDAKGQALLFFGGAGDAAGQMCLPAKVAVDADPANVARYQALADPRLKLQYLVWVTNQYGPHRLSVYGFGTWQEEK